MMIESLYSNNGQLDLCKNSLFDNYFKNNLYCKSWTKVFVEKIEDKKEEPKILVTDAHIDAYVCKYIKSKSCVEYSNLEMLTKYNDFGIHFAAIKASAERLIEKGLIAREGNNLVYC